MCRLASNERLDPIFRVGLVFFALANVARYLIARHTSLPTSLGDGMSGFLFGVAIGLLLLGLYRRRGDRRPNRGA